MGKVFSYMLVQELLVVPTPPNKLQTHFGDQKSLTDTRLLTKNPKAKAYTEREIFFFQDVKNKMQVLP